MDYWVQKSQVWLNGTYLNKSGYVPAPTNGLTGYPTMYSLTRALQIELKIAAPSDNFGSATFAALGSQFPTITSSTTNKNVLGILQCAMWCKGYIGGYEFGKWDGDVTTAVLKMKGDLGLSANPSIEPKLLKSLLTMDAYVRVGTGTDQIRTVQKWLNGRYLGRRDFYLIPCDGIYSRGVQEGLMFALQYEIGMTDGVATGNFGPATKQGVRDYGDFGSGATDGARKMVSIFQASLIFNTYGSSFTGTFDSATQTKTRAFQQFVGLSVTGRANYATWASLLVSSGDTSRSGSAADTSTGLTSTTAAQLYTKGYRHVGRYINGAIVNGVSKRIGPNEQPALWAAGLKWFPIYQEANDSPMTFSSALGNLQGQRAAIRMRQLGIKSGARVYLAVDFDATSDDIAALVIPHFRAVLSSIQGSRSVSYSLGVYGTRNVCAQLASNSITSSSFVSDMSTGYSGNLGFPLPANWAYDQIQNLRKSGQGEPTSGTDVEIDKDIASTRAQSISSSDVVRTPREYGGGNSPVAFDELFHWRVAALAYAVELVSPRSYAEELLNDFLLCKLQKPTYWGGITWPNYTPLIENGMPITAQEASAISSVRYTFEGAVGTDPYLTPQDGRFGQTDHFAASTRGYLQWGVPAAGSPVVQAGDLGACALDLVQAWNQYEFERVRAPGGVLDVRTWFATKVGFTESSQFGPLDLRADMAAFLCAKRMKDNRTRMVDDVAREMLVAIEDDPGWLAKGFFAERFLSRDNLVRAARDSFASAWPVTSIARDQFLTVRGPGTSASTLNPSANVRSGESEALANGFADVVEKAMLWTDR